jgi:LPXTG-motif cell wall-anchored protein
MSKRSPQSSSLAKRARRHWLLLAVFGLAVVALWAGQPALAADARPQVNQTVPPATPRPEVPPPDNKDKKDDKKDNQEDKTNNPAPAVEQAPAEPTAEITPEVTVEAAAAITAEVTAGAAVPPAAAAEAAATAEQAPESLPATGGETSLPLMAGVAGAALLALAGAAFVTRRSA